MTQLYTVSFTTQTLVKKCGPKGKIIGETRLDKPIVMHALPYATAMSYSACDGFKIEPYVMDEQRKRTPKGSGRDESIGNGTKKVNNQRFESAKVGAELVSAATKTATKLAEAAATGNLGASFNV